MVRRFAAERPRAIVIADRDLEAARELARELGEVASAQACDVSREADSVALIQSTVKQFGRLDLYCANAGVGTGKGIDAPDEEWLRIWNINLMSHVWTARAL